MTTVRSTVDAESVELTLELPAGPLTAGSTVEGELTVRGGPVGPVVLALFAGPADAALSAATRVAQYRLTDSLTAADRATTVPATVAIPHWTPVSRPGTTVRAATGVDAVTDPDEARTVEIEPGPVQSTALEALSELGFAVEGTRCVSPDSDDYGPAPGPVQLFECVPVEGPFERRLDRLDVAIRPDGREMAAYLDVHREGGLFSETGGSDGRTLRVALDDDLPERVEETLSRHV